MPPQLRVLHRLRCGSLHVRSVNHVGWMNSYVLKQTLKRQRCQSVVYLQCLGYRSRPVSPNLIVCNIIPVMNNGRAIDIGTSNVQLRFNDVTVVLVFSVSAIELVPSIPIWLSAMRMYKTNEFRMNEYIKNVHKITTMNHEETAMSAWCWTSVPQQSHEPHPPQ